MNIRFNPEHYLDLVALGIVADVAEQQGDTRYLLQKGLIHLRTTKRIGLQTLYRNANLNPLNLTEDHIGFQIAPTQLLNSLPLRIQGAPVFSQCRLMR